LECEIRRVHFAIILGTADDLLTKRGTVEPAVRDNLILELGMFVGRLGRRHAVLLVPSSMSPTTPSDLAGLTFATYSSGGNERLDAETLRGLQIAANDLSREFAQLILKEQKRRREEVERSLRSERLKAIGRLLDAAMRLREICVELPGRALRSLEDKRKFDEVKAMASKQVHGLHDAWRADAVLLEVSVPLRALVEATCATIERLPYPALEISQAEATSVAREAMGKATASFSSDGLGGAAERIKEEVLRTATQKLSDLLSRYQSWWEDQVGLLRPLATDFQDRLAVSAVKIGLEASSGAMEQQPEGD